MWVLKCSMKQLYFTQSHVSQSLKTLILFSYLIAYWCFLLPFWVCADPPYSQLQIRHCSRFHLCLQYCHLRTLPIFIYQSIQRRNFRVILYHPFLCHMDLVSHQVSHQVFLNGFLVYCFWYSSTWVHVSVVSSLLRSRDWGRTISVHPPVSGYLGFFQLLVIMSKVAGTFAYRFCVDTMSSFLLCKT